MRPPFLRSLGAEKRAEPRGDDKAWADKAATEITSALGYARAQQATPYDNWWANNAQAYGSIGAMYSPTFTNGGVTGSVTYSASSLVNQ